MPIQRFVSSKNLLNSNYDYMIISKIERKERDFSEIDLIV
jgi:hypothetical protein